MSQVLEFERVDREVDPEVRPDGSDRRMAITVIVTGLVSMFAIAALEPAPPHHTEMAWEVVAEIGAVLFFGLAFLGSYALLQGRAQMGFAGLMAAAWVQLALVVGCPVSGHHNFGGWWAGQMAIGLAFVAVSTVAYGITRSRPAPRPAGE